MVASLPAFEITVSFTLLDVEERITGGALCVNLTFLTHDEDLPAPTDLGKEGLHVEMGLRGHGL
jgi:hypothetical protein